AIEALLDGSGADRQPYQNRNWQIRRRNERLGQHGSIERLPDVAEFPSGSGTTNSEILQIRRGYYDTARASVQDTQQLLQQTANLFEQIEEHSSKSDFEKAVVQRGEKALQFLDQAAVAYFTQRQGGPDTAMKAEPLNPLRRKKLGLPSMESEDDDD
ncbi:unnamed protein product, partial [Amoebophrya sp. A120]